MTVLLIDDHLLVNAGLASCLEETGRFTVCKKAYSLSEARSFVEEADALPSLIILDIQLGDENGLDFIPFLKEFCKARKIPAPPVLVCSAFDDPFRIQTALKLGAAGYVPKSGSKDDLFAAIETVCRGKVYITDQHNIKLDKVSGVYAQFTKRELEILNMVKQDKTNAQIANLMYISKRTVENHISNIYMKTGTASRKELMKL